jgi:hypothetical protein
MRAALSAEACSTLAALDAAWDAVVAVQAGCAARS